MTNVTWGLKPKSKADINKTGIIMLINVNCVTGMVSALDDSVGSVVRTLEQRGMLDNTILVFTTDNGGPADNYDGNAACNVPLR